MTVMVFEARYQGHCEECDSPIEVGDLAFYARHLLVHVKCPQEIRVVICRVCHLTKPCECDN